MFNLKSMITKIHLHATNLCTSNCRHCSVDAGPHERTFLTGEDFKYIIDLAKDAGVKIIEISGGEPLTLGEELLQMIRYAHDSNLFVSLLSNGSLLNEKMIQKLRSAGTGNVSISIYGTSAKTHEDFTQTPHSFSKAIEGIKKASNASLETIANVVVTPKNLDELQLLPSLLGDSIVYAFASVVPSGRGAKAREYIFSEDGYERAIRKLEEDFSSTPHYFLNSMFPGPPNELQRYCSRPAEEIVIDHEGYVIPCCLLPRDLRHHKGNVKERNLQEIIDTYTDSVFYWLRRGHKCMRNYVSYDKVFHNLCKSCIDMLNLLTQ